MGIEDNRIHLAENFEDALLRAIAWLQEGGVVGVPTESSYGLAVLAHDDRAVARLARIKGREPRKPMPLVAHDATMLADLFFEAPENLARLMEAFWPGPLTAGLVPKQPWPAGIVGPSGTVGIRVSAHPVLGALSRGVKGLITATSANLAGEPAAFELTAVPRKLFEQVLWLDAGKLAGGAPSTVVLPATDNRLKVARMGAIDAAALRAVVADDVWV